MTHTTSPSRPRRTASHRLALAIAPLRLLRAVAVAVGILDPALPCRQSPRYQPRLHSPAHRTGAVVALCATVAV